MSYLFRDGKISNRESGEDKMAETKAHRKTPKATYGKQIHRGDIGEQRCMKILRKEGYTVSYSKRHPRGKDDIIAKKGKTVRHIQVKAISSRSFKSEEAARNRIAGKPFNVRKLPKGYELWVLDKENRLYRFKK